MTEITHLEPRRERYEAAKIAFLEAVRKVRLPTVQKSTFNPDGTIKIHRRGSVIGAVGRSTHFGVGARPYHGYIIHKTNAKYPELFNACVAVGNSCVPIGFKYSTITLNHNVMAKKHIDSKNVGNSIIVGIGTYTDGGLYVYDKTGTTCELFEIQDRPTMFNGAILPHETQEYTGERYTLIFYNQPTGLSVEGVEMVGC